MSEHKGRLDKHTIQRLELMFALSIFGLPLFAVLSRLVEPGGWGQWFAEAGVFVFIGTCAWSWYRLYADGQIQIGR
ncbi:hypothetical protein AQ621_17115 (plasmid) [Marinobacter sp. P4B1]|nr:hypothetical protein AQ621_17115 [Marinobacter sp. P4B1]